MNAVDVALLQALRNAGHHLTWSELAGASGTGREHVAERMAALQEAGFVVEDRPGFGLRLVESPDRLMADDLFARLGPDGGWRDITVYRETDSTNERAAALGRAGVEPGAVIFAETQSAGRGRFGRRWASASGCGLWFSTLLRPEFPLEKWPRLTTWAAVSVARAVSDSAGIDLEIKWPNDLVFAGKKVAGILTEMGTPASSAGGACPFAVLGVGINVNQAVEDFPDELRETAVSLRLIKNSPHSRPELAAAILREMGADFADFGNRFDAIVVEARRRSCLLGKRISARAGSGEIEGVADDLDEEGRLLLRDDGGTVHVLGAGEVSLRAWQ